MMIFQLTAISSLLFTTLALIIQRSNPTGNGNGNGNENENENENGNGILIPLTRHDPLENNGSRIISNSHLQKLSTFHETRYSNSNRYKKRGLGSEPLTDHLDMTVDVSYYGPIIIGTNSQTFQVIFDTGLNDILIPLHSCDSGCNGKTTYDPWTSAGIDQAKSFKFPYGRSKILGEIYSDYVTIGGYNVSNQIFGAYTSANVNGFPLSPIDGIVGMSFSSFTYLTGSHIFQNLILQKFISQPLFGFFFAHGGLKQTGSELLLGSYNKTLAPQPTYHSVKLTNYWYINLDSVNINGNSVAKPGGAIIDTMVHPILGPKKQVKSFWKAISGSKYYDNGFFSYPCDSNFHISFTFDGVTYPMRHADLLLGGSPTGHQQCIGTVKITTGIGVKGWVVGLSFLSNVYTIFDLGNNQVGFNSLLNATEY